MGCCPPKRVAYYNSNRRILKVLYSAVYGEGYPFSSLADKVVGVTKPSEMIEFDSALVVWGGADISPDLYGHPMSRRCAPYAGRRDRVEWELMREAIDMEIPIIGVCRGAQMLCAAAGGVLLQDVNNHGGYGHEVTTHDGQTFHVNSIHHQMMVPYAVKHELLAWATTPVGAPYIWKDDKIFDPGRDSGTDNWREPEFVYFPDIDGYAIQWHPEGMKENCPATKYILDFFNKKQKELRPTKTWLKHEA